ncbi:MAG: DUF4142 domain-containing protein [Niabella sp.]|nr:DUF4142 domain-containing protein [Niabella sp.]
MKPIIFFLLAALMVVISVIAPACSTVSDSKKAAEDSNTARFNKSDTANPSVATLEKDADFAVTAADGGLMEVKLGQLALQHGRRKEVKAFGRMMIKDHTAAGNELKALATQKNMVLPDSLSDGMKKKYNRFLGLKGDAFDKAYIQLMVEDHQEDVAAFRHYAGSGADQNLVQWANRELPVLEAHLQQAKQVAGLLE